MTAATTPTSPLSTPPLPGPNAPRAVLFTAFEPSGDDHASAVIAELRRRWSPEQLPIYAWGGPKMEKAGATIIQHTGENAIMGLPGLGKLLEHRRINQAIKAWLDNPPHTVAIHIPVDSPAANFPICAMAKQRGIRVLHLVAPQIWAWAEWRIKKLRRRTDMVLCLLPFEENWFLSRGVKARFIGHPLFDQPLDMAAIGARAAALGGGSPKIGLMPGSRPKELRTAFPVLLDAFRRLREDFPTATGVVAATRPAVADQLREAAARLGGWPDGLKVIAGDTDAVIAWCDFALVVSGTVTLQVARQCKPMVTFYPFTRLVYYGLARWLLSTPVFTLPNLTAGKRIVPELIPHFGDGEELALGVIRLMRQTGYADDQRAELARVVKMFHGRNAARAAAEAIGEMAELTTQRITA